MTKTPSIDWRAFIGAACLVIGLCAQTAASGAAESSDGPRASAVLSLERVFRMEPYIGKQATRMAFSGDGRFLAYLWNPRDEPGLDLYVNDTQTGKTIRVTSPALLSALATPEQQEREARAFASQREQRAESQGREEQQAAYLRGEAIDLDQSERQALEALRSELAARKAIDSQLRAADAVMWSPSAASAPAKFASRALEDWELRDELKAEKARESIRSTDVYPGVTQFVWARQRHEMVLQYRGQLLRWELGTERPVPLLALSGPLQPRSYTVDDQGLIFVEGTSLQRLNFANATVEVLSPQLPPPQHEERKFWVKSTVLSEDQRWMAVSASTASAASDTQRANDDADESASGRQVDIMNFTERFATPRKRTRDVSDEKRALPAVALYIMKVPTPGEPRGSVPKPVFTHPGGDMWFKMTAVSWSRDGRHYAFATFERERELYRVFLGRSDESAPPEVVLERRGVTHNELEHVMYTQFTPDSLQLVVPLADKGWRQAALLKLSDHSVRPLVQGDFEAHRVLGFSPDSESAFIVANKDDLTTMNLWRVRVSDGSMAPLGRAQDYHRNAVVDRQGRHLAATAGQWSEPPELKLFDTRDGALPVQVLTQSHDPAWADVGRLRPQMLTLKNRHGDTLHAYIFKPDGWRRTDNRPAVVYVYGGPLNERHMVEPDDFRPTPYLFGMYMAARHGYVMVTLDPRGGSNYGQRFSSANFEHPGQAQTEDLEDLAAYMSKELGVDSGRIGLTGWSFGGFQTQYTMYTKPELFAAGIAGAGPTQWENYYADYSGRVIGKLERGKPVLRKYSLLPLAKNLKRPLMLAHGMQDANVLFQDTVNVYRELQRSGKQALVELFLDPDGDHGMHGGVLTSMDLHRKYEAFWLSHLGEGP